MDNRVTDQYSKMPGLGDIPILGNLFRSKNAQKSATELVVLCTVHRISASTEPAPTPKYPQPFMDKGKFDGPSATGGGK
jgi:pilus assembly protein CpaC